MRKRIPEGPRPPGSSAPARPSRLAYSPRSRHAPVGLRPPNLRLPRALCTRCPRSSRRESSLPQQQSQTSSKSSATRPCMGLDRRSRLTASQLYSRCKSDLTWYVPNPFRVETGRGVTIGSGCRRQRDGCADRRPRLSRQAKASLAPTWKKSRSKPSQRRSPCCRRTTPPPVYSRCRLRRSRTTSRAAWRRSSRPSSRADPRRRSTSPPKSSSIAAAWPRTSSGCAWTDRPQEDVGEVEGVELDNNGNAFVLAIGDSSCAEGPSLIEADLESKPFTTFTTNFTTLPPQPTGEPTFTIEKRQQIAGGGGGFTAVAADARRSAKPSTTRSSSRTPPTSPRRSANSRMRIATRARLPAARAQPARARAASSTYTCHHLITVAGRYVNEATVTATRTDERRRSRTRQIRSWSKRS